MEREDGTVEILRATHLKKYYGKADNTVKAVDDISLSVRRGEFVSIVGSSGSGKTTLLNLLGTLDRPDSGEVRINGSSIAALNDAKRTVFRRRNIGFVFQDYNLMPASTVYNNVVLPIRLDGNKPEMAYIEEILELLGLSDKKKRYPGELSGGQRQRVAIARALAAKPEIILADEPTGNLDSRTGAEVMGLLMRSQEEFHQTIIMITHNEAIAELAERIWHIEDGHLLEGEDDVRE